jgi:hypothetical protein
MTLLSSQKAGVAKASQLTRNSFVFVIAMNDKTVAIVFDQLHQINVDGTVASIAEQLRKTVR